MAFGTFDFFHAGHEDYLRQAKILGEELIVVVARDETVKKVKGESPVWDERRRLREVSQSAQVNKAVLGYPEDKYHVIRKFKPNILALGYDQFAFTYGLKKFLIEENLNIEIIRLQAFEPQTFKSSIIRQSLQEGNLEISVQKNSSPPPSLFTPCELDSLTVSKGSAL